MAARTISAAGGNWNAVGAWDEGVVPIAGDTVTARGGGDSGNLTINVASACASIILTNYVGTLTFNNTLTTTSTVTFPAGMTCAGTGDLVTVTGSTITIACASGLTGGLRLGGTSQTYTLGSNWAIAGTLLFNGTTAITFSGAYNITAAAFNDTMTVSAIAMSGNITITGDAQFASGTSTTFTGGKAFQAATCTVSGGQTVTLTNIGSMTITGLTTSSTVNIFTGGTWNTGGLTVTGATTGTCLFNITGGTVTLTAALSCSMTFAGNVTWASQTNLYAASGTPTLTYSSGTITVGTSVLSIASSCTIAGNMPLYSLIATAALTLTVTGSPVGTGTFTAPNANMTITLSAGQAFTFATWANTAIASSAKTLTLSATGAFVCSGADNRSGTSAALKLNFVSGTPGTKATYTLGPGASQDVAWVFPTDIDSSNGQRIFTYKGTVVTSFNWSNSIAYGNLIQSGAGETLAVADITKDNDGAALGSCEVYLFKRNGNGTATFIGYVLSNAGSGAYSIPAWAGSDYFAVSLKAGATPVKGATYLVAAA